MKKALLLLVVLMTLLQQHLSAQDTGIEVCTSCSSYLYWTGEQNNDFFNERNWRVAVQLPTLPNPGDATQDPGSVKPYCLPGAIRKAYQFCRVAPDPGKDKNPKDGAINPGQPIRFNLFAQNANIEVNGAAIFSSPDLGFLMENVSLNIPGAFSNGVLSLDLRSTMHFRGSGSFGAAAIVNLLDAESWVYFHEVNPDQLSASAARLWVNDKTAVADVNLRTNQYYQKGAIIRMKRTDYSPLTIMSATDASAALNESIIYAGNTIPAGLNNKTSAFVLKRGYMATFAINENGTGKSKLYIASEEDLTVTDLSAALQGTISFIRVMPWNWVTKKGNGGFKPGVDAGWYYNWGNTQTSKPNYEYVPMSWGAGATAPAVVDQLIQKDKVTHLLASTNPTTATISRAVSTTSANRKWL